MSEKIKKNILQNHNLAQYTTWRIGGNAKYFYRPENLAELIYFLQNFSELIGNENEKIIWLGGGSNVLIRDSGIDGIVISIRGTLKTIENLPSGEIKIMAGASCNQLVNNCVNLGKTDAVFLAGIPGTIGGALKMNAGAHGDEIWAHVISVETINIKGEIKSRTKNEFTPSYRKISGLSENEWFISAILSFGGNDQNAAKNKMHELLKKRQNTQPLSEYNAGSVFKNPPNDYAARLIESCGLKGKKIGGAKVSEKHANFIVNDGTATSSDVELLIQEIIATVEKFHGIKLIPEIHILGKN